VSPITDVTPNALEAEFTTNITRTSAGNYLMRAFTRTRASGVGPARFGGGAALQQLYLQPHKQVPRGDSLTCPTTSFTAQWDTTLEYSLPVDRYS
jgi:hypothetical protein